MRTCVTGDEMRKLTIGMSLLAFGGALTAGATVFAAPLRIAAPQLFGMHCAEQVCVEDRRDLEAALELLRSARGDVEALAETALPQLRTVLCRSDDCYRRFGGGEERAISYPFLGAVIAGRSWQDYIVRHELIHWLQFEHYGAFETMSHPAWFREGMAYALSDAPDWDIPEPFKPWIAEFQHWQGDMSFAEILEAAPRFD